MIWRLYRTGFVQRYSTNPEMAWTGQTLGHHQWGVAVLMLRLFPEDANLAVVWEALHHDTGEMGACDASAPAKAKYPDMAKAVHAAEWNERFEMDVHEAVLTGRETAILKLCDRLESYLFAAVRTPWVLSGDGWPELRADVIGRAWLLGVGGEVEGLMREVKG
jgi:5'-deoxynucleotidase YfbR-like HD superfamily hydrolase